MTMKIGANEACWCGSNAKYKKCHRDEDRAKESLASKPNSLVSKILNVGGRVKSKLPPPENPVKKGKVSPRREVPADIPRPDYAEDGRPKLKIKQTIKTPQQIEGMRQACRAARRVLELVTSAVKPGITTDELDAIAHEAYIREGGYPSTLNYHRFPKSLCTSVNEVVCHGIPDSSVLREGDIINCDVTIYYKGFHGDCSETVLVGEVDAASRKLVEVTREAMYAGIDAARAGSRVRDIGKAIEGVVTPHNYGLVRAFVGHGIGEVFHMDPQVPHYYDRSARFKIEPGMTFTVEPMVNLGHHDHRMWSDNWTAVTVDLQRSAQFEHTILVTEGGIEILTLAEGEDQPFL